MRFNGAEIPVLDDRVLRGLVELDPAGAATLLPGIVTNFVEATRERTRRILMLVAEGNAAGLAANAQALRASSATVGATALARIADGLAACAGDGRVADAASLLETLRIATERTSDALRQFMPS